MFLRLKWKWCYFVWITFPEPSTQTRGAIDLGDLASRHRTRSMRLSLFHRTTAKGKRIYPQYTSANNDLFVIVFHFKLNIKSRQGAIHLTASESKKTVFHKCSKGSDFIFIMCSWYQAKMLIRTYWYAYRCNKIYHYYVHLHYDRL